MKRISSISFKSLAPLLALLLVLAGCRQVGALDLNKSLLSALDVRSGESSFSLSLELEASEGAAAEDREIIEWINSLSVRASSIKAQENGTVSVSGNIGYKSAVVPFALYADNSQAVLQVEGAKQPFIIPFGDMMAEMEAEGLDPAKAQEVSNLVTEFLVNNLPNPSVLQISPATETVYGETLNLTKVHAEVTGDELPVLAKSLLKSISEDTEGFKKLIGGLYDYLMPIIKESGADEELFQGLGVPSLPLDDKEGIVTVVHDAAKLLVDTGLLMYDQGLESLYSEVPEMRTVLSKETKLTADLYVDSSLHIRKQAVDFRIALPQGEDIPVRSVTVKSVSEAWNINGQVSADVLSADGALDLSDPDVTSARVLSVFDPQSAAYRILKEDMGLTSASLVIPAEDDYYYPLVIENVTMVPVRYVTEDLGGRLEWNGQKSEITVIDDLDGDKLTFKVDSGSASLNGLPVELAQPVFIDEYGDAYVPLRILAQTLGAAVTQDEEGTLFITRD